jgi:RNA polymerase sigma-70 factor (ECF subfamily)
MMNQPMTPSMSVTDLDRELLKRCLEKKNRAWEDFVDRFLGLALHIIDHAASIRNIRLSIEERNLLCQNVFAAIGYDNYRVLRQFKERSSLTTYLSIIVRRVVVRILLNQSANEPCEKRNAATPRQGKRRSGK